MPKTVVKTLHNEEGITVIYDDGGEFFRGIQEITPTRSPSLRAISREATRDSRIVLVQDEDSYRLFYVYDKECVCVVELYLRATGVEGPLESLILGQPANLPELGEAKRHLDAIRNLCTTPGWTLHRRDRICDLAVLCLRHLNNNT